MYWLLAQPPTVFSRIPPFCDALGRTQASTETALRISRLAAAGTVTVTDPEKAAAVSPLIAPGWPRLTPGSYTPARPLPLESAATLLVLNYLIPIGRVAFDSRVAESVFYAALVFSPFPANTDYFAPSDHKFMFNLIVDDLEGAAAQRRDSWRKP